MDHLKLKTKVEKTEEKEEKEGIEEKVAIKETDAKDGSPKAENKPKSAFAGFFSPKTTPGGAKRNEGGADYEKKVLASSYHPVDDSFWTQGEPTPFFGTR